MDHLHHIALLPVCQFTAGVNIMPLRGTATTAGGGGMLGDKYRVPAHRRLFTVIRNMRCRQPAGNKIRRVLVNDLRPFIDTVLPLFATKMKAGTKGRPLETGK